MGERAIFRGDTKGVSKRGFRSGLRPALLLPSTLTVAN